MKAIKLPRGTRFVSFSELPHLIAEAIWRDVDDELGVGYGGARLNLETELPRAARDGTLKVRDPLTFGPHPLPVGSALGTAVVLVDDLRSFVADRGLQGEVEGDTVATQSSPRDGSEGLPMKRAALVEMVRSDWPTIEADLKDASRNGLKEAAHLGSGWSLARATMWAEAKGKVKARSEKSVPASPWSGLSR